MSLRVLVLTRGHTRAGTHFYGMPRAHARHDARSQGGSGIFSFLRMCVRHDVREGMAPILLAIFPEVTLPERELLMSDNPILGDAAGPIVEVPAAEYAKGLLLGVLGAHVEPRYLVLPKGVPACVPHYRRCVNIRKDGSAVCYEPFRMGSLPNSEEIIPADQIARVMILHRGRLEERIVGIVRGEDGYFRIEDLQEPFNRLVSVLDIAFASYLQALTIGIEAHADPTLSFGVWLSKQDPAFWKYKSFFHPEDDPNLVKDTLDKPHDLEGIEL